MRPNPDLVQTGDCLGALSATMRAFAESATDYERLIQTVAEQMARLIGEGCIVALLSDEGTLLVPRCVHFNDPGVATIARALLTQAPIRVERGSLVGRVLRTRRALPVPNVDPEIVTREIGVDCASVLLTLPVRGLLVLPLEVHGRALGIVVLVRSRAESPFFTDEQQDAARSLADCAALAISNAELLRSLQRELEERKRAEDEMKRFVALIQLSSDFVGMATLDGRVLFVNEAGRRLVGLDPGEDVTHLTLQDFHTEQGLKRGSLVLALGRFQGEGQLRHFKTGELIDVQIHSFLLRAANGEPFGFATVQRDIRETKRLEARVREMQRMGAIGHLAGGVAHDFNNILSVILSYSSILLDELPPGAVARLEIEEIHLAGQRAAGLTHQLLAFSRRPMLEPEVVDINEIVTGLDKMTRRLLSEDIILRLSLAEGLGKVKVDVGQIEQVVINLVVNARDAMPQGGVLTIRTSNIRSPARIECGDIPDGDGRWVMLSVSDTGVGMDEATKQRIFEPFFTTKAKGKGTGLGLSTVASIVDQSGGKISVETAPGQGTTFEIYLPCSDEDRPWSLEKPNTARGALSRGNEAIMLVEDEAQVRKLLRGILSRAGYDVLDAGNAEDALVESERFPGRIHLLVTDVVMSKMNGRELAERLARARPDMRVLYLSGYSEETMTRHGVLGPGVVLLHKPVTPEVLLQRVREMLDAGVAAEASLV